MASFADKNGVLYNFASQAPSPSKDFCQIVVTLDKVIYRFWKITLRNNATTNPGEVKDSYDDFKHNERLHGEINRVFGSNMLEYLKGLVDGHIDYFPRLPEKLLTRIILLLPLEDIIRLSTVSKQFHEICSSNTLWQQIYAQSTEQPISAELEMLAEAITWKKLFFTNKIQLQMQLNRFRSLELPQTEPTTKKSSHFDLDVQLPIKEESTKAQVEQKPNSQKSSKRQSRTK